MNKTLGAKRVTAAYEPALTKEDCIVDTPNVWSRLDELDVNLQALHEHILLLKDNLNGVLKETEDYPVPGPRTSNSALTSRVCAQSDFVDDITRIVVDLRGRLTV